MTTEAKSIFTDIYLAFFAMPHVCAKAKYRSFEAMIENLPHPLFILWEITGITPAALEQIVATGSVMGIQRAHNMSRIQRGLHMFQRAEPMPDAYEFFYLNDKTVLTTKGENYSDSFDRNTVIPLQNSRFGRHTYSVSATRKVLAYLAEVHEREAAVSGGHAGT